MIDAEIEELFLRLDRGDTTWRDSARIFADDRSDEALEADLAERQLAKVWRLIEKVVGVPLSRDNVEDMQSWAALVTPLEPAPDRGFVVCPLAINFSGAGNLVIVEVDEDWRQVFDIDVIEQIHSILQDHEYVVIPVEQTQYPYSGDRRDKHGRLVRETFPNSTWYTFFSATCRSMSRSVQEDVAVQFASWNDDAVVSYSSSRARYMSIAETKSAISVFIDEKDHQWSVILLVRPGGPQWVVSVGRWWWIFELEEDLLVYIDPLEPGPALEEQYEVLIPIGDVVVFLPWWGAGDSGWAKDVVADLLDGEAVATRRFPQVPPRDENGEWLRRHRFDGLDLKAFVELEQRTPPQDG